MTFRIRWERRAMDALTTAWTAADSAGRQTIMSANHAFEQRLRNSPYTEGESRSRGRRVGFEPPLSFVFRVEADGRTVSVLEFRLYRSRK